MFLMVTVPVLTSVGFIRLAVRMAAPVLSLEWVRVPAVKTWLGLAEVEVNTAPLPTRKAEASTRVAIRMPPAAISLRRLLWFGLRFTFVLLLCSVSLFLFRDCIRIRLCNILCSHDPPAI